MLKRFFSGTIAGLRKDVRRMRARSRHYADWAEAGRHATYESEYLTEFRARKAEKIIRDRNYEQIDTPGLNYLRLCSLHVKSLRGDVRIVDFGGAFGEEAMAFLGGASGGDAAFTICESPAVVAKAATIAFPWPLSFVDTLLDVGRCDIFYSSGALPYIEQPRAVLEAAAGLEPLFILLVRNCFSERPLIRNQRSALFHNGPPFHPDGDFTNRIIEYPHQTLNLAETIALMAKLGYRLVGSFADDSGVYPYRNEVFGRDLIFASEALTRQRAADPAA